MPPFYKHRSDDSPGDISFPWRKMDEEELRKFMSVASSDHFKVFVIYNNSNNFFKKYKQQPRYMFFKFKNYILFFVRS